MNSLALPRDALLPRAPGGMGRGLALAVVAHGLLVAALSLSVRWHTQLPDGAEAELWAAVPQAAAPQATMAPAPAAEPRPERAALSPRASPAPPATQELPDAQIAIERKREQQRRVEETARLKTAAREDANAQKQAQAQADREKAIENEKGKEKAKATADAAAKSKDAAHQIAAQAERLEAQRQANLQRMVAQAGGNASPNAAGAAPVNAAPSAEYIGRIKGRIRPNMSFPDTLPGNPAVEIEVRVAADGRIMSTRILKPSGSPEWDDAVLRAIDKTEVLPRDENGRVPPALVIVYRARD